MCGIVGAVSQRNIVPILIEGLRRLEYRGYDSCGVAVHADGGLKRARSVARVAELDGQANDLASIHRHRPHALGHARRAQHGQRAPALFVRPSAGARRPRQVARSARVALVHNGIIENHEELRAASAEARLRVSTAKPIPKSSRI